MRACGREPVQPPLALQPCKSAQRYASNIQVYLERRKKDKQKRRRSKRRRVAERSQGSSGAGSVSLLWSHPGFAAAQQHPSTPSSSPPQASRKRCLRSPLAARTTLPETARRPAALLFAHHVPNQEPVRRSSTLTGLAIRCAAGPMPARPCCNTATRAMFFISPDRRPWAG